MIATAFSRLSLIGLVLLAFSLPFELEAPLWQVGPLAVTNVELVMALTLLFAAIALVLNGRWPRLPDRYWLWLLPFGLSLLLAAIFAPAYQANAFKAALRLISGIVLALATLQIVRQPRDGYLVAGGLLAGGITAAFIGMWESYSYHELSWLSIFRSKITVAGQYIRLTGPFDYANQTAMFIEATLPLLLALAWLVVYSKVTGYRRQVILLLLALLTLFYVQASILTFSRASFATIVIVSLALAFWLYFRQSRASKQMARWWLALALITGVLAAANFAASSGFRLRLQSGNEDQWYQAELETPASLNIAANESAQVLVTATNAGKLIWQSEEEPTILLGARWINTATGQEYMQVRWPFPQPVMPGQEAQLTVAIKAPDEPGAYDLYWDLVQEEVTWFGYKTGYYVTTAVSVMPGKTAAAMPPFTMIGESWDYNLQPIPNRRTLWVLAWQMIQERPWLGIGFDNFRLMYGTRLGELRANDTIHTNNWYLEMIVSLGIIGAIPFLLWLSWLGVDLLQQTRRQDVSMWPIAIAAGLMAFLVHGFLDFFLLFNATGLLFWLLAGLWIAEKKRYADWN